MIIGYPGRFGLLRMALFRFFYRRFKYYGLFSLYVCFLVVFLSFKVISPSSDRYFITSSTVKFVSEAPLEKIVAVSTELKGIIDTETNSFAFSVLNTSFKGFNSPLQEDHFNENYVESDKNPHCTFSGKIIDNVNFDVDGVYVVRAKGILEVRGIGLERIIKSTIEIKSKEVTLTSDFTVLLSDHEIRVPRIVQQKIAPEIKVFLKAKLVKETKK